MERITESWNDSTFMLWKEENSIMHITYKKNLVIDIETARQIVAERIRFFHEKSYPVLLDGRQTKLVTMEAIELFSIRRTNFPAIYQIQNAGRDFHDPGKC